MDTVKLRGVKIIVMDQCMMMIMTTLAMIMMTVVMIMMVVVMSMMTVMIMMSEMIMMTENMNSPNMYTLELVKIIVALTCYATADNKMMSTIKKNWDMQDENKGDDDDDDDDVTPRPY